MLYSQPYILLISFILIIFFLQIGIPFEEKTRKYINYLIIIVYLLFFGFRGFIGWDWYSYYPFFNSLNLSSIDTSFYDIGFVYYTYIIKLVFNDYNVFIFINSLINIILLYIIFNRYLPQKYFALALVIFLSFEGIKFEVDLLRNIKSVFLFIFSIKYIEKRNFFKFLLLNICGFLFHWSSIVYFPLYFFIYKKINIKYLIIFFIFSNVIFLSQIEYIKPFFYYISNLFFKNKIDSYLNNSMFGSAYGITLIYIEKLFISMLIFMYYGYLSKTRINVILINSFFISIIISFLFSEIYIVVARLSVLFIYSYWLLLPILIKNSRLSRPVLILFFVLFAMLKTYRNTNYVMYKYDNVLLKKCDSYQDRKKVYLMYSKEISNGRS